MANLIECEIFGQYPANQGGLIVPSKSTGCAQLRDLIQDVQVSAFGNVKYALEVFSVLAEFSATNEVAARPLVESWRWLL